MKYHSVEEAAKSASLSVMELNLASLSVMELNFKSS